MTGKREPIKRCIPVETENGIVVCSVCGEAMFSLLARKNCRVRSNGALEMRNNAMPKPCAKTQAAKDEPQGVGYYLMEELHRLGIDATPDCPCRKRARIMNIKGIAWCERNKDKIIGWLREEADKRKLWIWTETGARLLLWNAIRLAKQHERKERKHAAKTNHFDLPIV